MLRNRIPGLLFEAVADAPADAGGGEAAPEPVDAPAGDVTTVDAPADTPAAAEPFDPEAYFDTPEGRALLDQQVAARVPQPEPEPGPAAEVRLPPDPWTSDNYAQEMADYLQWRDQQIIGAVTSAPGFQHAEAQHANQWVDQQFADIERDLKLPDGQHLPPEIRDLAVSAAAGSVPPGWKPGMGGFDPGQAVATAAKGLHALIQKERAAALAAYQGGVDPSEQTPGGSEPPAGGLAAIHTREPAPNHRTITNRFLGHE